MSNEAAVPRSNISATRANSHYVRKFTQPCTGLAQTSKTKRELMKLNTPKLLRGDATGVGPSEIASDHESTNANYLSRVPDGGRIKWCTKRSDMKSFLKWKAPRRGSSSRGSAGEEDVSIYTGQPKSTRRTPKWPEQHNVVLGELLLKQFLYGNMSNGVLNKGLWCDVVSTLNRRLGTSYIEAVVMTRFKNMKSDFRMLYQLSNRSGWGWDEALHIPIATDEIWEKIIQEYPQMAHFRRNPFHQYDIFKKICADNISIGWTTRSSKKTDTKNQQECYEDGLPGDNFMSAHGVSFVDAVDGSNTVAFVNVPENNEEQPTSSPRCGSKWSSGEMQRSSRRSKRRAGRKAFNQIMAN